MAGLKQKTLSEENLSSLVTQIGEVQDSPTSYTLLARIKSLLTGIVLAASSAIIGKVGIDQTTPGTTNAVDATDRIGRLVGKITNYDVLANGTITALNGTVEIAGAGLDTIGLGISGTWVGTLVAEVTVGDGVWDITPLIDQTLGSAALSTTVNGNFLLGIAGALTIRIRASLWTSGTATIYLEGTSAAAGVFLSRSIPTGVNTFGKLAANSGVDIGDVDVPVLQTLTSAADTTPTQITKTVAATGTPEALAANGTFFRSALLIAKKAARTANVGNVYLGIGATDDTQPYEIAPGDVLRISADPGQKMDLNDWYLDVLNAGDGAVVIYT